MEEYSLIQASREDSAAIRRMVRSANLNPTGLDWRRFVLAVDRAGQVIGCVQRKPHRDGSVELASLVVVESWQGRGIARVLIEEIITLHQGWLFLMCRAGLEDFYQRFGFVVLGRDQMPVYFRRISQLASRFQRAAKIGEGLLIMGREC